MVSVTHRLNLFGFLYLADLGGGEKWANASNVGMQDIVAALAWIKENIAAFGGNPGNVTVFGQSGGGSKVTTLMAMPSAKGLFHRAIAMSGAQLRGATRENATRAAEQFLAKLGLKTNQLDRLQQMPWQQLQEAFFSEPRIQGLGRRAGRRRPLAAARSVVSRRAGRLGRRAADDGLDRDRRRLERSAAAAGDVGRRDADARQPHRPQRRGEGAGAGGALPQDAPGNHATPTCG